MLRGSLHGVVRVLQVAQLHRDSRRLSSCLAGGHVLPRVGQQVDLGARVVVPKSQ